MDGARGAGKAEKRPSMLSFLLSLLSHLKLWDFAYRGPNSEIDTKHVSHSSFLDELLILWALLIARASLIFKLA